MKLLNNVIRRTLLGAVILLFTLENSMANPYLDFTTGHVLLRACTSEESEQVFVCGGYVKGAVDTYYLLAYTKGFPRHFCLPVDEDAELIASIVIKYLQSLESKRLDHYAVGLIGGAFAKAYPCKD